ncbi:MAG: hypothetical protein V4662_22120 [Verrucomicrobiota bacterium]
MITTLTPELTTAVPPELARQLNLRPGTQLDWEADADGLVIHVKAIEPSREELLKRVRELGRKHKLEGVDAIGDLIREREQEHEMRERVLS